MSRTTSRAAILGAIALLTAAAAVTPAFTSAWAQPADASKPAPAAKPAHKPQAAKPKPANTAQQTPQRAAPPMQAEPPAIRPNPVAALFGKTGESATITPEQRALVDKINAYMSGMQNLNGSFIQVGPDGKKSQGTFYIQKPGKVRFEYDPPSPMELIADGDSVVVRDRNLATQDVYPLSQTPLRYLLASKLDLLRDTNVTSISADDLYVSITIEEKQAVTGTSRLTLMTGAKDGKLKQWTVTDPQGYDTTVAVYNLDTTKRADPNAFRIDYTRNIQ